MKKNRNKEILFGVMQGRLLPKYQGRYQAHPIGYWQKEFSLAAKLELNFIEFILDFNDVEHNPLMHESGIEEILILSQRSGVTVKTICADYFMEAPLHSPDDNICHNSQQMLLKLIKHSAQLDVTDIVIPCVDHASLADERGKLRFIENLKSAIEDAENLKINLSLETDLAPTPFIALLEQLKSTRVTVNYDTGNSASLGYNPKEELSKYGRQISDIHIKDRVYEGGPITLGEGDTDFDAFIEALKLIDYQGPFIMQAYRDDEGLKVFKSQLEWIKKKFESCEYRTQNISH